MRRNGVYTAREACREDPRKPPLLRQVKAAHYPYTSTEKMIYFRDALPRYACKPIAWFPRHVRARPDGEAREDRVFLMPQFSSNSAYGFPPLALRCPTTSRWRGLRSDTVTADHHHAGAADVGRWRQRLENGYYTIRAPVFTG